MKVSHRLTEKNESELSTSQSGTLRKGRSRSRLAALTLFVVLGTAFVLYCAMITPHRFGDYGDDGVYVSAAKALATGQGYTIINLPQEKAQTLVPPFYPFLLSLIWRAYPQFPENVTWMMMLSAVATLSFLALTYRYLVAHGYATQWQALIVVALAGINWRTMLHGTSVMSEMVYAALAVAALYMAERYEKEEKGTIGAGIAVGVVIGLAFLTRSSGIALLIASAFYFVIRGQWKRVLVPAAVASLFVLSWMSWSYFNPSTAEGVNAVYYSNYFRSYSTVYGYLEAMNDASKIATILNVLGTNVLLLIIGSIPLSCLGLRYDLPQSLLVSLVLITIILIAAGFIRQARRRIRLLHIYLSVYLGIYLVSPGTAYDRYIVPIVPFLIMLLVTELAIPVSRLRRELMPDKHLLARLSAAVIALALSVAVGIVIYSNGSAIHESLKSLNKVARHTSERTEAFEWIKANTDRSDILVCNSDAIYYLYTGRKAVLSFQVTMLDTLPYRSKPPESSEITEELFKTIDQNSGRYLISNASDFADISDLYQKRISEFITQHPEKFVLAFESSSKNSLIYRIEHDSNRVGQ